MVTKAKERSIMKIHAIQTGTVFVKQRQMQGKGHGVQRLLNTMFDKEWSEPLPIYAWVIEHPEGIIVVDTGETARTAEPGYFPRWHPYYKLAVRIQVAPEEEIGPQLRTLGIAPEDVRQVILTHMHTDHAGGLSHFPKSEILVTRSEYEAAKGVKGQIRGYLPQHWPSWFRPTLLTFDAVPFGPFANSHTLTKAGDVILVSTIGHAPGHMSVILKEGEQAIFFAGDTSYNQRLMLDEVLDGVAANEQVAGETVHAIHTFVQQTPTVYLPSHDPAAARRLAERETVAQGEQSRVS
jgi:glyoxylase-like metal-dependent hydrolase (beta-lactamase superfamily II)